VQFAIQTPADAPTKINRNIDETPELTDDEKNIALQYILQQRESLNKQSEAKKFDTGLPIVDNVASKVAENVPPWLMKAGFFNPVLAVESAIARQFIPEETKQKASDLYDIKREFT
jgi:hypothetical protein